MHSTYLELQTINEKFASQIVAFSISASGAMGGDAGTIIIATLENKTYTARLDDEKTITKLKKYFKASADDLIHDKNSNWKLTYLGMGNNLFLIDWLDDIFYLKHDRNSEANFDWVEEIFETLKQKNDCNVKQIRYNHLCRKVAEHCKIEITYGKIKLGFTDMCKEINTWTYWQGKGNLSPQILLVGQDWGGVSDAEKAIQRVLNGEPYNLGTNPTNINLTTLFDSIGYDLNVQNSDLFFTNLIPHYRLTEGISGGYSAKWLTDEIKYFFNELVDILNPKVILCLGKSTFCGALKSLGDEDYTKHTLGRYNQIIEKGFVSVNDVSVFPLAHCGSLGTNNRNKGSKTNSTLELQLKDLEKVKLYIDSMQTIDK